MYVTHVIIITHTHTDLVYIVHAVKDHSKFNKNVIVKVIHVSVIHVDCMMACGSGSCFQSSVSLEAAERTKPVTHTRTFTRTHAHAHAHTEPTLPY